MALAISIHIGVSSPSRDCCSGAIITGMEAVADAFAELARKRGFQVRATLKGGDAKRDAVKRAIADAARELNADPAGSILFLSFCGHGCRVPATGAGVRESDRLDETWCLADGSLSDNEIHDHLMLFDPGIRILAITESCHSGGSIELPIGLVSRERGGDLGLLLPPDSPPLTVGTRSGCFDQPSIASTTLRASVLVLAACQEKMPAEPGLFIGNLFAVWRSGFTGNYCEFMSRISARVALTKPSQTPAIYMLGPDRPSFPRQTPFTTTPDQ